MASGGVAGWWMMDGWMVEEDHECGTSECGLRSSECGMSEGVGGRGSGGEGGEDEDDDDVGDAEMGVSVSDGDGERMAAERASEKSDSGEDVAEFGGRVGG